MWPSLLWLTLLVFQSLYVTPLYHDSLSWCFRPSMWPSLLWLTLLVFQTLYVTPLYHDSLSWCFRPSMWPLSIMTHSPSVSVPLCDPSLLWLTLLVFQTLYVTPLYYDSLSWCFRPSMWPLSIALSASLTNIIRPPKYGDRISSTNSWVLAVSSSLNVSDSLESSVVLSWKQLP